MAAVRHLEFLKVENFADTVVRVSMRHRAKFHAKKRKQNLFNFSPTRGGA